MSESLQNLKRISHSLLEERIDLIKELAGPDPADTYAIVKDLQTDEHYLLYRYVHLNIAEAGHPETFTHLMPLDSDGVLSILFDGQSFLYPESWKQMYLRNGEQDTYVWFDPSAINDQDHIEAIGNEVKDTLQAFKNAGKFDSESVQHLLELMDRLNSDKE